ncbi:vacuolar carboxypeptidase-like protein Cps1 [Protomyces lactucae-debilis]|uniref:Vacuolar carboxypeptidase-like protein Cps1 n=1 Tax=Protomyces lactucae-debilis TaxID=2754530 RepID=A0A1Y2FSM3_PROLT|nr:vacuolar carboxypeptidase-like protein Cps1 [Protomyces lactucae-debilis]ORY87001.1 vacuolar carboxypeptidase-like protein Cps1 [Protomyces lactucae-debilis]
MNVTPLSHGNSHPLKGACRQADAIIPGNGTKLSSLNETVTYLNGDSYKAVSQNLLSKAVTFPTVSYDDLGAVSGDDADERWATREPFIAFLAESFPLLHQQLKLERINTYGLLYTWQGSDASLKPTVLMAHTDVVPVAEATINQWSHPPFSGDFDGTYIWGRGASDCKNQLMAILESVTVLLEQGFAPKRTVVLSFGFDEEISGGQGAGTLAPTLIERYGEKGAAVIVDEGNGFVEQWGSLFASPGVTEKGHINVEVTIRMPGGHSSVPVDHTAIGVAAELVSLVEGDRYPSVFNQGNPFLEFLTCGAVHAPSFPRKWRILLTQHSKKALSKLAKKVAAQSLLVKYLFTTSIAVDVIRGGVKVYALPELVETSINHRVNIGESTADVKAKIEKLAKKVAKRHGLELVGFDAKDEQKAKTITLSANNVLEPAPLTPTGKDTPYAVIAGTTRALYDGVVVAPGLMTGNTDTRYYWALTDHIFRYSPARGVEGENSMASIHTVNEKQSLRGHLDAVTWFWTFIRNMDVAQV